MKRQQEEMAYFDLEPNFRKQLYVEYSDSVFSKTIFLVLFQIVFFIVFSALMEGNTNINGDFKVGFGRNPVVYKYIPYSYFLTAHLLFHILIFCSAYHSFKAPYFGLKKDYQSGKGIKKMITIVDVMQTPAAPIYVTDSPILKTIDNAISLQIGDQLMIYYLEFSGRLLHIEPEIWRNGQPLKA